MARALTSAQLTAIAQAQVSLGHLVALHFGAGSLYFTDRPHDVVYGGNTYTASGNLLGTETVSEELSMRAATNTVQLSGVNLANLSAILNGDYTNRSIVLSVALFDANDALIDAPIIKTSGLMDAFKFTENPDDGEATLELDIANHWTDFDRVTGRLTNTASQKTFFPNDLGFNYTFEGSKQFQWGS